MDEYIKKADAVHALCKAVHKDDGVIPCENQTASCLWSKTRVCDYAREIDALPSADVQPVRLGHWIKDGHHIKCDQCGQYMCDKDREGDTIPQKFCPNCGARMDGEQE